MRDSRVLHHLGVEAVTMGTRLEDYPGEDYRLAWFQLRHAWKGRPHLHVEIVADAFFVVEGAVLPPDFCCFLSHAAVDLQVLLRYVSWGRFLGTITISNSYRPFIDLTIENIGEN